VTDPMTQLSAALADRYAIERELGQGGMATVYLAQDLRGTAGRLQIEGKDYVVADGDIMSIRFNV
jgi:ribosome-binding ATPase YchF (GTP1/OBG family)